MGYPLRPGDKPDYCPLADFRNDLQQAMVRHIRALEQELLARGFTILNGVLSFKPISAENPKGKTIGTIEIEGFG